MAIADFRCVLRFRVPFCDVDMLQHVNHASYVVWAETVRSNYFEEVLKEKIAGASGVILARLEFDYEQPLDYREEVAVGCRISRMGRKSFDLAYEIWSDSSEARCARTLGDGRLRLSCQSIDHDPGAMAQTHRRLRDSRTERGLAEVHSRASIIFEQDTAAFFALTLADLKVPQNHGRNPKAGSRKSHTHGQQLAFIKKAARLRVAF